LNFCSAPFYKETFSMKKYLYLPCVALLALAACDDSSNNNQQQSDGLPPPAAMQETVVDEGAITPETADVSEGEEDIHELAPEARDEAGEGERIGNSGPPEGFGSDGLPPAPNPEAFNEDAKVDMSCGDHTSWVGSPVDEGTVKEIGQPYRIVRPGMPMTMDYRADRINVEIDDADMVVRVWCG
jgi:hypothetical protein